MNEDTIREELYTEIEEFYQMITSNDPINLEVELDKFIETITNIREEMR